LGVLSPKKYKYWLLVLFFHRQKLIAIKKSEMQLENTIRFAIGAAVSILTNGKAGRVSP